MPGIDRDRNLEKAAFARARRLAAFLRPGVKARLSIGVRALLAHLASAPDGADLAPVVRREIRSRFAELSSAQFNLLHFYVLAKLARILSSPAMLHKRLEAMNEMSEELSLRLQMMMDRRSKFIQTLSNMMKKISQTQDSIVGNLK